MNEHEIVRAEVKGMNAKSAAASAAEVIDELAHEVRVLKRDLAVLARLQDLQDANDCQCNVCLELRMQRWPERRADPPRGVNSNGGDKR